MKEYVRKFILTRARDIFLTKGFKRATIEEIAAAADLSKPTIYNYFTGKRELFFSVLDDLHEEVASKMRSFIDDGEIPFPDRLWRMTEDITRFFFQNRGLIKVMMAEQNFIMEISGGKELDVIRRHLCEGVVSNVLTDFFRGAVERKEIGGDSDPRLLSMVYIGLTSRIYMNQALNECDENEFLTKIRQTMEIFCYGVCRGGSSSDPGGIEDAGADRRRL